MLGIEHHTQIEGYAVVAALVLTTLAGAFLGFRGSEKSPLFKRWFRAGLGGVLATVFWFLCLPPMGAVAGAVFVITMDLPATFFWGFAAFLLGGFLVSAALTHLSLRCLWRQSS
jgi:hypothetical protein